MTWPVAGLGRKAVPSQRKPWSAQPLAERSAPMVDIRGTNALPAAQRLADILVIAPAQLIATKVIAFSRRKGQPKSGTDWRDVAMLLFEFPDLKRHPGLVTDALQDAGADETAMDIWREEFVSQDIEADAEWGED